MGVTCSCVWLRFVPAWEVKLHKLVLEPNQQMDVPRPKACRSSTLSKGVCCKPHRCWGTWLEPGAFLRPQGNLACFHPALGCCTSLQGLLGHLCSQSLLSPCLQLTQEHSTKHGSAWAVLHTPCGASSGACSTPGTPVALCAQFCFPSYCKEMWSAAIQGARSFGPYEQLQGSPACAAAGVCATHKQKKEREESCFFKRLFSYVG